MNESIADPPASDEPRPYWQSDPCPAWCEQRHSDADCVEDRRHVGGAEPIPLTLAEPVTRRTGAGRDDVEWTPPVLIVDIVQGWRECAPEIRLSNDTTALLRLTEAEGRALIARVASLLDGQAPTAETGADS